MSHLVELIGESIENITIDPVVMFGGYAMNNQLFWNTLKPFLRGQTDSRCAACCRGDGEASGMSKGIQYP